MEISPSYGSTQSRSILSEGGKKLVNLGGILCALGRKTRLAASERDGQQGVEETTPQSANAASSPLGKGSLLDSGTTVGSCPAKSLLFPEGKRGARRPPPVAGTGRSKPSKARSIASEPCERRRPRSGWSPEDTERSEVRRGGTAGRRRRHGAKMRDDYAALWNGGTA